MTEWHDDHGNLAHLKLDMSTARRRLKSPRPLSGSSTHPTTVTRKSVSWSWKDDSHPFRSTSVSRPIPEKRLFQTLTLKLQSQGHSYGQRARSYDRPSTLLIPFLFISHQSDQQSPRCNYFDMWPWKIHGRDRECDQRSKSPNIPNIQPMHFLFVSHQADRLFLRYDQKNVWP